MPGPPNYRPGLYLVWRPRVIRGARPCVPRSTGEVLPYGNRPAHVDASAPTPQNNSTRPPWF